MPRVRKIRTKSGRLTQRARRIRRSGVKPGETIIIDVSRRHRKGRRTRNAMQMEMVSKTQFSVDLDIRPLLHFERVAVAVFFRDHLLAGQRADGSGPLPMVDAGGAFRGKRIYGVESKFMANNWLIGPIKGSAFRAKTWLKPNGADGRNDMIEQSVRRGIDFQSVVGPVQGLMQDVMQEWLSGTVTGDGVRIPADSPTRGGVLPDFL